MEENYLKEVLFRLNGQLIEAEVIERYFFRSKYPNKKRIRSFMARAILGKKITIAQKLECKKLAALQVAAIRGRVQNSFLQQYAKAIALLYSHHPQLTPADLRQIADRSEVVLTNISYLPQEEKADFLRLRVLRKLD